MREARSFDRSRIVAAGAALGLQLALGWLLLSGLAIERPALVADALKVFEVAPPPPRVEPPPRRMAPRPSARAAPPARRSTPTPIVAPEPCVPPPVPPLIVTAELPALGVEPAAGAVETGPGTGSAGVGDGRGSGLDGDGDGGGGTPARWLRGRITGDDYPRAAAAAGIEGSLDARYVVGTDGRVASCTVIRSSGSAELDAATCRLVRQRFRYRPARDDNGRKVADVVIEDHHWILERPDAPRMTPLPVD